MDIDDARLPRLRRRNDRGHKIVHNVVFTECVVPMDSEQMDPVSREPIHVNDLRQFMLDRRATIEVSVRAAHEFSGAYRTRFFSYAGQSIVDRSERR